MDGSRTKSDGVVDRAFYTVDGSDMRTRDAIAAQLLKLMRMYSLALINCIHGSSILWLDTADMFQSPWPYDVSVVVHLSHQVAS